MDRRKGKGKEVNSSDRNVKELEVTNLLLTKILLELRKLTEQSEKVYPK